ncbi:hypothetical protein [Streptomyces prunicolor]|uniref:hypothetical protein n=1 Tax=Streptomyces prunicolor TaxID=67348 RepID=UPI00341EE59D
MNNTKRVLVALALATVPLLLTTTAQADPTPPAASEQGGSKFHNVDVVSFLPGVVDESWIFSFGGKK